MSTPLTPIQCLQTSANIDTAIEKYTKERTQRSQVADEDIKTFAKELISNIATASPGLTLGAEDIKKLAELEKKVSPIHKGTAQKIYDISMRALLGKENIQTVALVETLEFQQRELSYWEMFCNYIVSSWAQPQIYLQRLIDQTAPDLKLKQDQVNTFINKQCLALEYLSLLSSNNIPLDPMAIQNCIEFADMGQGELILNQLRTLSSTNLTRCFSLIKVAKPEDKEAIITTFLLLPDLITYDQDELITILQKTITATGRGLSTFEKIKSFEQPKLGHLIRLVNKVEKDRKSTIQAKEDQHRKDGEGRADKALERIELLGKIAENGKKAAREAFKDEVRKVESDTRDRIIRINADAFTEMETTQRRAKQEKANLEKQLGGLEKKLTNGKKEIRKSTEISIRSTLTTLAPGVKTSVELTEKASKYEKSEDFSFKDLEGEINQVITELSIDIDRLEDQKLTLEASKDLPENLNEEALTIEIAELSTVIAELNLIKATIDETTQKFLEKGKSELIAIENEFLQSDKEIPVAIQLIESKAKEQVDAVELKRAQEERQINAELNTAVENSKIKLSSTLNGIDTDLQKSVIAVESDNIKINTQSKKQLERSIKQIDEEYENKKEWAPVAFLMLSENILDTDADSTAIISLAEDLSKADPNKRDSIEKAAAKINDDVKKLKEKANKPLKDIAQYEEAIKEAEEQIQLQELHLGRLNFIKENPAKGKDLYTEVNTRYTEQTKEFILLQLAADKSIENAKKYSAAAKNRNFEFLRLAELKQACVDSANAEKVYEQADKDLKFQNACLSNLKNNKAKIGSMRIDIPFVEERVLQIKSLSKYLDTTTDAEEKNCMIEAVKLMPVQYQQYKNEPGNRAQINLHHMASFIREIDPSKREAVLAGLSRFSYYLDSDKEGLMIIKLREIQNEASPETLLNLIESISVSSSEIDAEMIKMIYSLEQKILESGVLVPLGLIIKNFSLSELKWINEKINTLSQTNRAKVFSEIARHTDPLKFKVLLAFPAHDLDSDYIQKVSGILSDLFYTDVQPILESIGEISPSSQPDFVNKAISLFDNTDSQQRAVIVKIMILLYQNWSDIDDPNSAMMAIKAMLKDLSLDDLNTVLSNLKTLQADKRLDVINTMATIDSRTERLRHLSLESTEAIDELFNELAEENTSFDRKNITAALNLMPSEGETTIKELAKLLQDCGDRIKPMIKAIIENKVSKQKYSSFIALVRDLLPDLLEHSSKEQNIIRVLSMLPNETAKTIRATAALLEKCGENGKMMVIEAISDPVIASDIPKFIKDITSAQSAIKTVIPDLSENDSTIAAISIFQRLTQIETTYVINALKQIDPSKSVAAIKDIIKIFAAKHESQKGVQDILSVIGAIRLGATIENISSVAKEFTNALQARVSVRTQIKSNLMNLVDQTFANSIDAVIGIIDLLTPEERVLRSSMGMEALVENIATRFSIKNSDKNIERRTSALEAIKLFPKGSFTIDKFDELMNALDTIEASDDSQRTQVIEAIRFVSNGVFDLDIIQNTIALFADLGGEAGPLLSHMKDLGPKKAADFVAKAAKFFIPRALHDSKTEVFEKINTLFQNTRHENMIPTEFSEFSLSEMEDILLELTAIRNPNSNQELDERFQFIEERVESLSAARADLKRQIMHAVITIDKNHHESLSDLVLIIGELPLPEAAAFLLALNDTNITSSVFAKAIDFIKTNRGTVRACELLLQGTKLLSKGDQDAGFEELEKLYDPKDKNNTKLVSAVKLFESAEPVDRKIAKMKEHIEEINELFTLSTVAKFPLVQREIAQTLSELEPKDRHSFRNEAYEYLASARAFSRPRNEDAHLAMLRAIRLFPPAKQASMIRAKLKDSDVLALSELMYTRAIQPYHANAVIKIVELIPKEKRFVNSLDTVELIKNVILLLSDLDSAETAKLVDVFKELANTKSISDVIIRTVGYCAMIRGRPERFLNIYNFLKDNKMTFKNEKKINIPTPPSSTSGSPKSSLFGDSSSDSGFSGNTDEGDKKKK